MKRLTCIVSAALVAAVVSWGGFSSPPRSVAQDKEKGMTFEIYKDRKEEFRWRLKAANGNIMATSGEGYKAKADCQKGIESVKAGAASAKVEDTTSK
jgi:uncharacterized protein YegP (UPF0339 family)